MMRTAFEVRHAVFFEFSFKPAGAAPGSVLPSIVREHLFGRLILADGNPIHFDHRVGRGAAKQVRSHNEP
jgi:hypothetical protein